MLTLSPRAVIWDMDGTLVDSAEFHWRAWQEALGAEGFSITHPQFLATFGQRNDTILRTLYGPDLPDALITRIGDAKEARYCALVHAIGIVLLPGVGTWLERLHIAGWRQAIASAAPRANIDTIVAALGLHGRFGAIVAAEDVQRGKPDPQVFLLAAGRLGVPPVQCIVVEDALAGIEGAHRAGMRSIGVGPNFAALPANRAIPSLDQLPDDAFDQLVPASAGRESL
jgi:beta-phosphoglucomutase